MEKEKPVDRMDIIIEKREALELVSRRLDNKLKVIKLKEAEKELQGPDARTLIDQIALIKDLITLKVIDDEAQIFPSEVVLRNVFSDEELELFKKEVFRLLKKF